MSRPIRPLLQALVVATGALYAALPGSAAAASSGLPLAPFFTQPRQAPAQPQLAAAPDVVTAFGLERMPELFRVHAPATPALPRLGMIDPSPSFPRTPHIPELFGAKPCPERGPGFYRIKDTTACIHVGGRVGAGVQIGGRGQSGAFTYGRIQADVVTPTEFGDITLSMGVQGALASQGVGPIYVGPRNIRVP